MTEEEKKEFEEFLQWKKERAKKKETANDSDLQPKQEENGAITDLTAYQQGVNEEFTNSSPTNQKEYNSSFLIIFIFLFIILVVFLVVISVDKSYSVSNVTKEKTETTEVDTVTSYLASSTLTEINTKQTWDITISQDEMTDTKNIWAEIKSKDFICQDFPYDGLTYANITVRYMKKYGYDVLIQITKGQIDGRSYYSTNYITARFDEGTPKKYYYNESADGSSDVVFLRNKSDFINRCKKANDIKIDIPIYKSGRPVFTFHVDEPLVWPTE